MIIKKINIENFKYFKGKFTLEFNNGINILVGNNETGKSTILEAIHLALSGWYNGKYLKNDLSQYLFNIDVLNEYFEKINQKENVPLPYIKIEVFLENVNAELQGKNNSDRINSEGVVYTIEFDEDYMDEYELLIQEDTITTLPIEYYKITWKSFAGENITSRSIPLKSVIIDSSTFRFQNGSDVYISRIIKEKLDEKQKVSISQTFRKLQETFREDKSIKSINKELSDIKNITDKEVEISVNIASKEAWSTVLMTYLNKVPFHQIGKGEQCIIKTNLALTHKKNDNVNLILLEEPENHLSYAKLNAFIKNIIDQNKEKQIIVYTHSSFVANKLGLENIILLHNQQNIRLNDLEKYTYNFFKKLPGFDTLRFILNKKIILVEGPSDELIVQKAYLQKYGKLPIEDEIDVLSVKLAFKRFLDIAIMLNKKVAVITDNDGNYEKNVRKKYQNYENYEFIKICADKNNTLNTLEPQFVEANKNNLELLCEVIGINSKKCKNNNEIAKYMENNKTDWALAVFETTENLNFPRYIEDAIEWLNNE